MEPAFAPSYGSVAHELHIARQHLYDLVSPLSQDELRWIPPRPDGVCVSYHFGHIALVEDLQIATASDQQPLAPSTFRDLFGPHNANNGQAAFPSGAEIIGYMQRVRERTLAQLALGFRAIRDTAGAVEAAEPFRGLINHEYSHTKYIRRICAEMNHPPVDAPASTLIVVDESAIAAPQYRIDHWVSEPS